MSTPTILYKGGIILIGSKPLSPRNKYTSDGVVGIPRTSALVIKSGLLTAYDLMSETVTIVYSDFLNVTETYHMSYFPLGIGIFGVKSFMPPEQLPFSHSGFIAGRGADNICMHNSTGTKCRIIEAPDYNISGVFTLEPLDGSPARSFTSIVWDRKHLIEHLESLKGKELTGKGNIRALIKKGVCENQLLLTDRTKNEGSVIVEFPDGTLTGYPLHITELG